MNTYHKTFTQVQGKMSDENAFHEVFDEVFGIFLFTLIIDDLVSM